MTGFNLPPGCTNVDIDRAAGVGVVCECCGRDVDDCICPECPQCKEAGNPYCYQEGYLQYTREQLIGKAKVKIACLEEQLQEERFYLEQLESGCELP